MSKHLVAVILAVPLLSVLWAVCADLGADTLVADRVDTLSVELDNSESGEALLVGGLSVEGSFSVLGTGTFSEGLVFLPPLGDVPMGAFTNSGSDFHCQANPSWWQVRGVIGAGRTNDFAAAVQAQVKWIALQAAAELDERLAPAGGAGTSVSNLIASFTLTNNFQAVTLGQLKFTAKQFYDRLIEIGVATNYPWSGHVSDFSLANVGQVKFVFSFDLGRDSDGDGIPDGWEAAYYLDPFCNDSLLDSDIDGLINLQEYEYGTNPIKTDSDNDEMPDGWEIANGLDPLSAGTAFDPDNDLLTNIQEYQLGTDPLDPDSDMDEMPDGWEDVNGFDPLDISDAILDPDGDELPNVAEYENSTDPSDPDTEEDGLPDGWEVQYGLDPLADDASLDPDNDGLLNDAEYGFRTDPLNPDTDSDDMPDGWESDNGFSPRSGLTESLVGWWQFREGAGTNSVDLSGNGNDAFILVPDRVSWVTGAPAGGAVNFSTNATLADGLILWNRLGSSGELTNSVTGPDGALLAGTYVTGVFGKALQVVVGAGPGAYFPVNTLPRNEGCMEFWAKLTTSTTIVPTGDGIRLMGTSSATGSPYATMLGFSSYDASLNGGLCVSLDNFGKAGTGFYKANSTFTDALAGGSVAAWHHYAIVWSTNQVPGLTSPVRNMAVYVDGALNTTSWRGATVPPAPLTYPDGYRLVFPHLLFSSASAAAVDNLKIWDYPKTNFADRFTEGAWYTGGCNGGYVCVPGVTNLPLATGFSVAAWVRAESFPSNAAILTKTSDYQGGTDGFSLNRDDSSGALAFYAGDGTTQIISGSSGQIGVWTHVCGVYDGTNASLFINGQLCGVRTNVQGTVSNPGPLWIGSIFNFWHGDIADARLYTSALSAQEISTILEPRADEDGDGLFNQQEYILGSSPRNTDTDGDGLNDRFEIEHNLDPVVVDMDPDLDGLPNVEEAVLGTDPLVSDTDDDGLSDGNEVDVHRTDPLIADTDGDGLSDGEENDLWNTLPLNGDTDDDGMFDGWEVVKGLDPLNSADATLDPDTDGLTNLIEYQNGTEPFQADSDYDAIPDGWEVDNNLNPLSGITSGLLGWWQFREGAGTNSVDLSGHGKTACFVRPEGTHVHWESGSESGSPIGDALDFWNSSCTYQPGEPLGFVRANGMENAPFTNGFTWASWVRTSYSINAVVASPFLRKATYIGGQIEWGNGSLMKLSSHFILGQQEGTNASDSAVYGNVCYGWQHVCGVYDASNRTIRLYLDGVPIGSNTNVTYYPCAESLWIGSTFKTAGSAFYPWVGKLADVRIYTSALTDSEVQELVAFKADPDGDGLTNRQEYEQHCDPHSADTDGDHLSDGSEVNIHGTDPCKIDTDGDFICDDVEVEYGLDPTTPTTDPDIDSDGLNNEDEATLGTHPFIADTDEDGLSDGDEYLVYHTAPLAVDTDEDGLEDGDEVLLHETDPLDPDTDSDGLDDAFEVRISFLSPVVANTDPDDDGLSNWDESLWATNPIDPDTDSDGLPDLFEVENYGKQVGPSPFVQTIRPTSQNIDPDQDGLGNASELLLYNTDPILADTDADGLADGEEAAYQNVNSNCRMRDGFNTAALLDFSWLGTVATNGADNLLTSALYAGNNTDNGIVTAALPFPVKIGGLSVSNFAASVNGVAWLLAPGRPLPSGSFQHGVDLRETVVSSSHITVAPLWSDLTAQSYGENTNEISVITVAGVTYNGVDFNIIEWRNMGFYGWAFPTNRQTFQIIIPAVPYTNVYANALFTRGLPAFASGSGPANSATYGAQGPREWQQHILCFHNVNPSSSFYAAYILGTGSDPLDPDKDGDGLMDGEEIAAGTDPGGADSDSDGLPDGWEIRFHFNPLVWNDPNADSDGDGLTNLQESMYELDPDNADTDGDGIEDGVEVNLGLNPSKRDTDGDGIEDADELVIGTDPLQPDTDGDGLPDGWEYDYGMDPTTDNTTDADPDNDPDANPDGDGLTNAKESDYGTNPFVADTDGDGVNDGDEVAQGSDPLDPNDHEPRDTVTVSINFGDPSISHSEKYRLTVKPVSGDPRPAQKRVNHKYGECELVSLVLVAGAKYTVTIAHVSTNLKDGPDLDYDLGIWQTQGASGVVLLIDDPCGMLGFHTESEWSSRAGHSVNLFCVRSRIIPDRDRNGVIDESDSLLASEPLRMWLNDDADIGDTSKNGSDIPGTSISPHANSDDGEVNGHRDLLDFFPVWLDVHDLLAALPQKTVKCRLRNSGVAVNVVYTDLSNTAAGDFQKMDVANCGNGLNEEAYMAHNLQVPFMPGREIPPQMVQRMRTTAGKGVILLEGRLSSTAPLELDIMTNDIVVCTVELPLQVAPVEQMFNQVSLRNGGYDVTQGASLPPFEQSFGHVFFLHGFHVGADAARAWGAEMFKRFWQSGSRARFHAVTWDGDRGVPDGFNYHDNVVSAFETAPRLKMYVRNVQAGQKVVIAHSLGNMVVSSAIEDYGMSITKYFMLNAAAPAEAYDDSAWNDAVTGNPLVSHIWTGYQNQTWCAKWHELFQPFVDDDRRKLTWKNRFGNVPASILYNYYSSGDEVLGLYSTENVSSMIEIHSGTGQEVGNFAWQKQERFKGRKGLDLIAGFAGTEYAGWGMELFSYTQQQANGLNGDQLRARPVFRRSPPQMFSSSITADVCNSLLALAIPALSGPVGSRNVVKCGSDNYDMNSVLYRNGWPRTGGKYGQAWLHSDMKDVAYYYNWKVFDDISVRGEMK